MTYTLKGSKPGDDRTRFAVNLTDAAGVFLDLIDQGFVVHVTDDDTGQEVSDEVLVDIIEREPNSADRTP